MTSCTFLNFQGIEFIRLQITTEPYCRELTPTHLAKYLIAIVEDFSDLRLINYLHSKLPPLDDNHQHDSRVDLPRHYLNNYH